MAVYNLEKSIEISADLYGREDSIVLRDMTELADWLHVCGRPEEADEWHMKKELILRRKLEELEIEEKERWARYKAWEASERQGWTE